ncbi:MAG: metallophosphoesterase [Candidatus Hydrogenedentes bacterium]|nr:metallophosphoesterase [Candidatus Hydrogenedentota bacterium]
MWRFVHISDPHLSSTRDGVWNNRFLCSMMPDVLACLRSDIAKLNPDFILVTGDIVSHRSKESVFNARDMLDSLGIPYYPMGGNHDFYDMDSRAWFLDAYSEHLPTPNTVYTFLHRNVRFCVLDPWCVWDDGELMPFPKPKDPVVQEMNLRDSRWALPPEQFVWLESVLQAFPELPTCLALHYPALPVPVRLRRPDYNDAGSLENGDLLVDVLSRYPHVKAIFSGHVHTNTIVKRNELVQITTSALPEYPVEFREVRVYNDRMEVCTHGLSDSSFSEKSLIAGREYTAGEEQDRSAVISLK